MRKLIVAGFALAGITVMTASGAQDPAPYDAKAGITLMRAINTAENAGRRSDGYVALDRLVTHSYMGGVAPKIAWNGHDATYLGQSLRLMVSADNQHYHASLVPLEGCGVAVFTDERGLIYTGKVLDCP